jgi:hypothetical protein
MLFVPSPCPLSVATGISLPQCQVMNSKRQALSKEKLLLWYLPILFSIVLAVIHLI